MMQQLWAWLAWQIEEAGQREAQRRVGALVGRGGGGVEEMVTTERAGHTSRQHRARQVRAHIVALAQEYREACRQHEEIAVYVFRLNGEAPDVLLDEEERVWEAREMRRRALWAALEELERLEGAGRGGNG